VIQLVLPLDECAAKSGADLTATESVANPAATESIVDLAAAESATESLHSIADSAAAIVALTKTSCLCVQV
jgi:hypothetical protein